MSTILVGMADLKVARSPDMLTTLGLGSCVGVTLYDARRKIGGLAHFMLPNSAGFGGQNRAKFADTAIPDLISAMLKIGAERKGLIAKIAGGAHMFGLTSSDILKVGDRNVTSCLELLSKLSIPVYANDTGGKYGRTIELYTETGVLRVKSFGSGEKLL